MSGLEIGGFEVGLDRLVLGLFTGMVYGLLAIGLVLVYRASRFINFAHGAIGVFGAAIVGLLVTQHGVAYWPAVTVALVVAGVLGATTEVVVIRPLRDRPRLIPMVATLGLGQFILVFALLLNPAGLSGFTFPRPVGLPSFQVGTTPVGTPYVAMLTLAPLVLVGLALFLTRSRQGLAIRAAADDPDGASLTGVNTGRMAASSWALAGVIAALSAILVTPTQGAQSIDSLGPDLLLKGLAGAVIGRMTNLPAAFAASLGIGVLEQVLVSRGTGGGLVEVALLVVVLVGLLLQPGLSRRGADQAGWLRLGVHPLPASYRQVWAIRHLGHLATGALLLGAAGLAYVVTNSQATVLILIAGFTLVGASVLVVTGMGGQLSLGQFAFAGIGAAVSVHVATVTGRMLVGVAAGLAAAALAAVVVGIPALRLRGLALAVTTLAFALASSAWLLRQPWLLGNGIAPPRPTWGGYALDMARDYYLFALLALAIGLWAVANLRRSGLGRLFVALRDNEDAARALAVPATRRKLQLYALAGAVAGLGGLVVGHGQATLTVNSFPVVASIEVVAIAVVGGLGLLAGPLLGSLLIVGLPGLVQLGIPGQAALTLAWLLAVILLPRGLAGGVERIRDVVADWLARRAGIDPGVARATDATEVSHPPVGDLCAALGRPSGVRVDSSGGHLRAEGITRWFGGVKAVGGVDLEVAPGEIVGIIGPNGAGKTTLFEVLAGFSAPDAGTVTFDGHDVTRATPERRAREGLVRSFQDARLFPTLTVRETVRIAGERTAPSWTWPALIGAHGADDRKAVQAEALIGLMGLAHVADRQVGELSMGTRRLVELACLLGMEPRLLLLDEPSAGLSQAEGASLAALLRRVNVELGTTLLVIEHDLPLLIGLAHRMVAMELGQVIAEGTPQAVCAHPAVVRAYMGDDQAAVARSGTNGWASHAGPVITATTRPPSMTTREEH